MRSCLLSGNTISRVDAVCFPIGMAQLFSVASFLCGGAWLFYRASDKIGLAAAIMYFRSAIAGVRYGMICFSTVAVSAVVAPVTTRGGLRLIPSVVVIATPVSSVRPVPQYSGSGYIQHVVTRLEFQ